jgi:hypothetical protein
MAFIAFSRLFPVATNRSMVYNADCGDIIARIVQALEERFLTPFLRTFAEVIRILHVLAAESAQNKARENELLQRADDLRRKSKRPVMAMGR